MISKQFASLAPHGVSANLDDLLTLRFAAHTLNLKPHAHKLQQGVGTHLSRQRGRGLEFEEVRAYQPGDDVRSIDWRVTARSGRTYTRLFREEQERPLLLAVDQRPPMGFGSRHCFKSVMASYLAALLGWAGLQGGDRVGGMIFSAAEQCDRKPLRQRSSVLFLLQELCRFNQQLLSDSNTQKHYLSLAEQILSLRRLAHSGSGVFLISDFHDWNNEARDQIFLLARQCDLTLLKIYDPLEMMLPDSGIYTVTDGQQKLSLDTSELRLRKQYQKRFNNTHADIEQTALRLRLPLLHISTADNPLAILQQQFGAR
jgi:uncharacterized protein (DUF58 family)